MTSILKVDTIQDTDGNNIINESSDTITIGASGDTVTIPSGATISNLGTASGFGGGVTNYFFAWDSDTGGVSGDIILDTTQINSGSNYSTGTGLYTAPSAGDYFFQVNFRRGGSGSADLYFEKNGSAVSSTVMQYSATSVTTATFSVILTLASSDTIGWHSVNNVNPAYCKFFGWRMS
jgi:hypothetical protein